ncbi:STAS domain-containing protein [Micromonosporaceae bacterium Da 78-11]
MERRAPTMSFDCTIHQHDDTITVIPEGDISLETIATMREVLRQVVESREGGHIDVDMSEVTFLDSSGIGMLVAAKRAAAAKGTALMLTEPGPMIRMVLEISNLHEFLIKAPADQGSPAGD